MSDGHLVPADPGAPPTSEQVQQLVEAETGLAARGILRRWLASDSARATPSDAGRVVLTSDASGVKISRDGGSTPPAQVVVDGTAAGGSMAGTYPNPTLSTATLDALIPPGTIWAYGGAATPAGWLPCDGRVVGKGAYPKLWAAIGGVYGPSDAINFTLPDLRGRVVLGASGTHPLGQIGGAETVAGPSHTHIGANHSHRESDHAHLQARHAHGSTPLVVNGAVTAPTTTPVEVNVVTPGTRVMTDQHGHNDTLAVGGVTDQDDQRDTGAKTAGSATSSTAGANEVPLTTGGASSASIATMPPFGVANYIIRVDA